MLKPKLKYDNLHKEWVCGRFVSFENNTYSKGTTRGSTQKIAYQQYVIIEKSSLDERALAISNFIDNNLDFKSLTHEEQERLKEQVNDIREYSGHLNQRIEALLSGRVQEIDQEWLSTCTR